MQKFVINQELLQSINLQTLHRYLVLPELDAPEFVHKKQHYALLALISTWFENETIIDIGTHRGSSALALSYNPSNNIFTFDIQNKLGNKFIPRVFFYQNDLLSSTSDFDSFKGIISKAPIILLDVDPHDGKQEFDFYKKLISIGFKGLLILDDIHWFKGMRDHCWYQIPNDAKKLDVTFFGHFSGTGIINFSDTFITIEYPYHIGPEPSMSSTDADLQPPKNYTVVTAYFNLTKQPDASDEIKRRSPSYYFESANMTMATSQNLVVFTDEKSVEHLEALRPEHLKHKTRYVLTHFQDFQSYKKWFTSLWQLRTRKPRSDPRNTASYYLFCMCRYEMLLHVISNNWFQSTHFAWQNIDIERMNGHEAGPYYNDIFAMYRDKFSTCWIDYYSKAFVQDIQQFFQHGGLSTLCSGFFTGNLFYMKLVCDAMLQKFEDLHRLEYGHSDEQVLPYVYFDHPEWFDNYMADYHQMISNYCCIRFNPHAVVSNFLQHLFLSRDDPVMLQHYASKFLKDYSSNTFDIDPAFVSYVASLTKEQ